MASVIPKFVKKEIVDGWVAENLYLMLLDNTTAPNPLLEHYVSDVAAREITGTAAVGYTAGGVPIAGKSQSYDILNPTNAFLDANDVSIGPGATLNYRYGVVFKNTGNQATSLIRCIIDFVTDQIVTNGTTTIQWNSLGIMYIS